jgi:hypothetical protein
MKTLIASKQNEEQKRSNAFVRCQFIMAMMNMDENMIKPLLKNEVKFMSWMSSWQLLNWFNKQFAIVGSPMFHSKFTEGISLDKYPGADIFEFSFAAIEEGDLAEESNSVPFDENAIYSSKRSIKLKLVLIFENGKIADIRIPKKVVSLEQSQRLQKEN